MQRKKGIDVSYAQGNIDFEKIKKSEVSFAVIRSGYGWQSGQKDSKFDRNIKGFQGKKIPCGAYHYSYAQSADDAVKEAKYCISCIKDYELQLPVFYDMENASAARLGKRICTDIVKTFCDYMKKSGYEAGIYMNLNYLENYVYKDELLEKYFLWLAQWGAEKPAYDCMLWQYNVGTSGSISGITGEVDLDYMYTKDEESDNVKEADSDVPDQKKKTYTYTYIVRYGDTLSGIAQKYHTTYQKIAEENHIQNPDRIYSGQVLYITV